jgi:hypothetical protein
MNFDDLTGIGPIDDFSRCNGHLADNNPWMSGDGTGLRTLPATATEFWGNGKP